MPSKNPWVLPDGYDENVKKAIAEIRAAFANAKKSIPKEALDALRQGNYEAFLAMIDLEQGNSGFGSLKPILQGAAKNSATAIYRKAGVGAKLTFDIIDEYSVNWASTQTGSLIKGITEEMRLSVTRTITEATMGDLTWQEAADQIAEYIPLTDRDAKAVAKYHDRMMKKYIDRKGWKEKEARKYAKSLTDAYAEKLTQSRARTIARTEIANAATQGEYIGWEAGVQSGMLDAQSQKEWIAEPNACEYCGAMDGVVVRWDEAFPILGGKLVPPAHPNCRCATAMLPPDYADSEFTAQALRKSTKWWNEYEIEFAKHLAGQHDQSSHGKGGSGEALKIPDADNNFIDASRTQLSNTKPYVGLSDKAKTVRAKISKFETTESIDILGRKILTSSAIYEEGPKKVKYKLQNTETIDAEGYSDSKITVQLAGIDQKVELGFLNHASIRDSWLSEPSPDFKVNRISGIAVNVAFQRLGIGTAMLEFARMSSPNAVVHSGQRSEDGDGFSEATKSALAKAILKHLAGQHDQSTHGKGGKGTISSTNITNPDIRSRMGDTYDKISISKKVVKKVMDSDGADWKPLIEVQGVELTGKCDYVTKSGKTIRLELLNETDSKTFSFTKVMAYDLEAGSRNVGMFNSVADRFAKNPLAEQVIMNIEVDFSNQRQGIATAMLEFARRETGAIRHSGILTDDGKAFSDVTKAILKHLAGQHDQSTHGRGGASHSTDRPYELKSRRADKDYVRDAVWSANAEIAKGPSAYLLGNYGLYGPEGSDKYGQYGGSYKSQMEGYLAARASEDAGTSTNFLEDVANDPDYPKPPKDVLEKGLAEARWNSNGEYTLDNLPEGRVNELANDSIKLWAKSDPEGASAFLAKENKFVGDKIREVKFANGQTVGEVVDGMSKSLLEQMQQIAINNSISLTMPASKLKKFIEEDHYRTAAETKLSGKGANRAYYMERREEYENNLMGIPWQTEDSKRPVYGVIGRSSNEVTYGDSQVIFKDDVKHRTTATIGDSLDGGAKGAIWLEDYANGDVSIDSLWETHGSLFRDTLGNDRRSGSTFEWKRDAKGEAEWGAIKGYSGKADLREIATYKYVETQIHGGLKLADVAQIVIPSATSLSKATQAMLTDKGIEVIVGSHIEKSIHA